MLMRCSTGLRLFAWNLSDWVDIGHQWRCLMELDGTEMHVAGIETSSKEPPFFLERADITNESGRNMTDRPFELLLRRTTALWFPAPHTGVPLTSM